MKLRTIENDDIEKIRIWRNEQIDVLRQYKPITFNEQQEYFKNVYKDNKQILYALEDETLIGYCGLVNINYVYSTAEISFVCKTEVNEIKYKEIFLFALSSLAEIAFNSLNLNKIWTETYDFREKHIFILEEFGFIKEGVLREHIFSKGKRHNSVIHSKLKREHNNEFL